MPKHELCAHPIGQGGLLPECPGNTCDCSGSLDTESLSSFTHLQVSAQLLNDQGRALASSWEKKGQKRCSFLLLFSHSVLSHV